MRSRVLLLLLSGLLGCFMQIASAAAVPLKGWVLESSDYPNHQGLLQFFSELKQSSKGRYEGTVLWRQDIGAQKDILPKFKKGELDFAILSNVALTEAVPEMEVLSLPFLFRDTGHMLAVLDGDIGKSLETKLAARGFIVLGWYNGGSRSFYSRAKPPHYSTEFEKLRIRVANRETMISMVKALRAEPSTLAYDKVGDALKKGELDMAENDLLSYEISEHYKFAPYYIFSHHNVLPEALVVSTQRWAALNAADRELVRAAAQDSASYMRKQRADLEAKVKARLEKSGVKFSALKGSENFVARMKDIYAPALKTPESTDLMFRIMSNQ
ncbi:TRAP transporter substrate-binding protein DctP [Uliginosibacterium sp. H3]|uniref:TRAP transporter substrate-binding protein DctP n=1 Tax=Uliginosibacterium silvisoli TaxID=3114758 RepID=A0ABU6K1G3_9RHOO|nr:TRAP transporter substrate-binding protein DctP [Uliginosibacterium sp. H3]